MTKKPARTTKPNPKTRIITGVEAFDNARASDDGMPEAERRSLERGVERIKHVIDVFEAEFRGAHMARAELLRPILVLLGKASSDLGKDGGLHLNNTDCSLLLRCLAEAGYKLDPPKPEREWHLVDRAADGELRKAA